MLSLVVDVIIGSLFGVIFFRLGLPSLMPLLVWVPLLHFFSSSGLMIGFIASSVWQLARPLVVRGQEFPFSVVVAWGCAGLGLLLVGIFFSFIPLVEPLLPFLLLLATGLLVYFFSPDWKIRGLAGAVALVCFCVGWEILHEWTIPLALPALLMGLFGFSVSAKESFSALRSSHAWRESALGVVLGVLPGLGPGLMGVLWHSAGFSPLAAIANLIFSVGFVALSGKVRSAPAEALAGIALPWEYLFLMVLAGACIAWGFEHVLPIFSLELSPWVWTAVHLLAFVWWGDLTTLGVVVVGVALHHFLEELHFPSTWGLLALIPSIVWFYS